MNVANTDEIHPGVVEVATNGIQDVSALLPLLGTERCEKLVTSALQNGLLYAAATPMSIFGSLGVAKAGFFVLWASIDSRWLPGPSLLRNAGFKPSGIGKLLVHVAEDNRHLYVAEDKLRRILMKKRIRSVKINLLSRDLILWNIRLVFMTVFLGAFGLLPYIFPIVQILSDQPFYATWHYPMLRIVGCVIVAITIQFVFQLRILEETYCRIRFMATDAFLKENRQSLPGFWDPNNRSNSTLKELRKLCSGNAEQAPNSTILSYRTKESIREGLGALSSFDFPLSIPPHANPGPSLPSVPLTSAIQKPPSNHNIAEQGPNGTPPPGSELPVATYSVTTTAFLCVCQAALLFGLVLVAVGYIGCFSVVQAIPRTNSKGPLVWLVCEGALAAIRTLLWAANPKWDDPKSPIALEKVAKVTKDGANVQKKSSYGIGWMLNSVTADDMHALIVGINKYNHPPFADLTECVADAKRVASYLEDTLLVPRDQIVTLHDSDATKERIIEELKALSHKASVAPDAPIVIYFATHTFVKEDNRRAYLVPHQAPRQTPSNDSHEDNWADVYIPYDNIVDLLRHIAEEKTDNIILILDSCHAAAMGRDERFDNPRNSGSSGFRGQSSMSRGTSSDGPDPNHEGYSRLSARDPSPNRGMLGNRTTLTKKTTEILVGHSSHILLAGTGENETARERRGEGGVFTTSLLESLKHNDALGEMTYKKLVDDINAKMKDSGQEASCTSIYQNRLLFNGLFSRRVREDGITPVITVQYSSL